VATGLVMAALAAAGCGGSSSAATGRVLIIGTTSSIDSLNPFVAIQAQAYNAFAMEYPQLVQYNPAQKLVGDWATRWTTSADGKTWTFHLKPGGKWSDGTPLTAADAAWTGNTLVKYRSGAAAVFAGAVAHVTSMAAPNRTTLVIHYNRAVGDVLSRLEQFFVLPEHVWDKHTGNDGADLKTFLPEQHLPTVAGGPYTITKYAETGATVFKPNPYFYGPRSHASAIVLQYYTNSTSMIADLDAGNLDFVDQVPFNAVAAVKRTHRFVVQESPGGDIANITFNSNPLKPRNRELLNPLVKEALEYATDRRAIASTVFRGYAVPWANLISAQSEGAGWVNPSVKPLPFDPAMANQILDSLGYKRGSGGIRIVPATSGRYAQPAHTMSYQVMVPTDLDFAGEREFQIIAQDWSQIGVRLSLLSGGDAQQAYEIETAGSYTKYDLALWDWSAYIDPDYMLSVLTRSQWDNLSDTGYNNPAYNAEYRRQATLSSFKERQRLVWTMERQVANARPYIQLVDEDLVTAHTKNWTGFHPALATYCKCYYTSPHPT
jgi:peptide/nickel transport system substrate-binding protein